MYYGIMYYNLLLSIIFYFNLNILFIQEGDVQMEETEDEQMARAIQMSMEGGSVRN